MKNKDIQLLEEAYDDVANRNADQRYGTDDVAMNNDVVVVWDPHSDKTRDHLIAVYSANRYEEAKQFAWDNGYEFEQMQVE